MDDWYYDNWNNWGDTPPWKDYKDKRIERQGGGHVMAKPEAKVMRRLRAETGLSEEEIRSHKKYRKMLSDAQSKPIPRTEGEVKYENMWPKKQFEFQYGHFFEKDVFNELWKRYAGGLLDDTEKRPKKFHYAKVPGFQAIPHVLNTVHNSTDGQYYYNPKTGEIGFMHESSLTMFVLAYQEFK